MLLPSRSLATIKTSTSHLNCPFISIIYRKREHISYSITLIVCPNNAQVSEFLTVLYSSTTNARISGGISATFCSIFCFPVIIVFVKLVTPVSTSSVMFVIKYFNSVVVSNTIVDSFTNTSISPFVCVMLSLTISISSILDCNLSSKSTTQASFSKSVAEVGL
eukprot:NODE_148_length_17471_cov_0.413136.p10 type:complete len:163 gc:universal NODE_148_length_17471_cov_0.413136:6799-7287(+)